MMLEFGRDTARFMREKARRLAGGFLLTLFSSFGQTFFVGLSGNDLRATFHLSAGSFGGLYMPANIASALSLPWLIDRGVALPTQMLWLSGWCVAACFVLVFAAWRVRLREGRVLRYSEAL